MTSSTEEVRSFIEWALWGWERRVLEMARCRHDPNQVADVENERQSPVQAASKRGHTRVLRLLLDAGGDRDCALRAASGAGHVQIVRMLLDAPRTAEGLTSHGIRRSLVAASSCGQEHIVCLLLDAGALDFSDRGWRKTLALALVATYVSSDRFSVAIFVALPLVVIVQPTYEAMLCMQLLLLSMPWTTFRLGPGSGPSRPAILTALLPPIMLSFQSSLRVPFLVLLLVLVFVWPTQILSVSFEKRFLVSTSRSSLSATPDSYTLLSLQQ